MLTQCLECELPVSDKANACPHCGYPLKPSEKQKKTSQIQQAPAVAERLWSDKRDQKS